MPSLTATDMLSRSSFRLSSGKRNMSNRRHAPSLDRLLQQAALHKHRRELPPISRIDRGLPFICETLAPLFYTPIYQDFTPNQRLRYNQLTGLYFNELIGYFEATFSQALSALICRANMPSSLRARC